MLSRHGHALSLLTNLGGKVVLVLLGAAILIGARVGPPAFDPRPGPTPWRDDPQDERLAFEVPEGELARRVLLLDESGQDLATLVRQRNGVMTLMTGRAAPARVLVTIRSDGGAHFYWGGTGREISIEAGPDGPARVIETMRPPSEPRAEARGPGPAGLASPDRPAD